MRSFNDLNQAIYIPFQIHLFCVTFIVLLFSFRNDHSKVVESLNKIFKFSFD